MQMQVLLQQELLAPHHAQLRGHLELLYNIADGEGRRLGNHFKVIALKADNTLTIHYIPFGRSRREAILTVYFDLSQPHESCSATCFAKHASHTRRLAQILDERVIEEQKTNGGQKKFEKLRSAIAGSKPSWKKKAAASEPTGPHQRGPSGHKRRKKKLKQCQ